MPRTAFDRELARLRTRLAQMGEQVDALMEGTARCLRTGDRQLGGTLFERDAQINGLEKELEATCMNLLALQQPLAADLRVITATLGAVTDIERVADQCADICEILATAPDMAGRPAPSCLPPLFEKARAMFIGALDAFLRRDADSAEAVCGADDEVDIGFTAAVREFCARLGHEAGTATQIVDDLFIAKYIERIADHATNIAEWAIFLETGRHPDLNDTQAGHRDGATV